MTPIHTATRAVLPNLKGVWRGNILLSMAEVHLAAGHPAEARTTLQSIADDATLDKRQRESAQERLRQLR